MCVFVVRGDQILALVNNMYVLEGKNKCLHLLHLCVERRVDRVIALIICVCVCGKGGLLLTPINSTCIIGNGTGTHYNCVCL